jgi:hypothetical protein
MVIIFETREDLMKTLPKEMKIAEVGVFKGEFSKFIFENLNPSELLLIDIFEGYMGSGDKNGNNMQFTYLENEYNNLSKYFENNKNVHLIKGYSSVVLNYLEDNSLDLIYIDASHEYIDVKNDLKISYNKVKNNGYICGHDYNEIKFPGVYKAVNEFCEEKKLKINYITNDGCPTFIIELLK